jgi:hypothetical protein
LGTTYQGPLCASETIYEVNVAIGCHHFHDRLRRVGAAEGPEERDRATQIERCGETLEARQGRWAIGGGNPIGLRPRLKPPESSATVVKRFRQLQFLISTRDRPEPSKAFITNWLTTQERGCRPRARNE